MGMAFGMAEIGRKADNSRSRRIHFGGRLAPAGEMAARNRQSAASHKAAFTVCFYFYARLRHRQTALYIPAGTDADRLKHI